MRVSTAVTVALTVLLVTSLLGAVAAAAPLEPSPAAGPESDVEPSTQPALQDELAAETALEPADPTQRIQINVSDDGDTRWTVESRFLIDDDEDEALFEAFADEVTSGTVDDELRPFQAAAETASTTTGREMSIQNAGWGEPQLEQPDDDSEDTQVGVISYSFTWTNFASVDGDRIFFGDAFETPGGDSTWFPELVENQQLVINSPAGYGLETPTNLQWDGPHQFEADELEIVFLRGAPLASIDSWLVPVGIGGVVLGAGGYVAYRYFRRQYDENGAGSDQPTTPAEPAGDGGSEASSSPTGSAHSNATASGTQIEYDERLEDDIDLELLSDEERVNRLLRRNGGRMKQATIVKETGWSNAKVSQLLSKMDDNDEIEKLRIGRENLITLPEVDPTEID